MEVIESYVENKDGGQLVQTTMTDTTPSSGESNKLKSKDGNGTVKKKRRRGKSKRKIMKPFLKMTWQQRRMNSEKYSRFERSRKILSLAKTQHAPFNNNQFLMEIHKPEADYERTKSPSGRTRDSSFSIDSDENYLFSLPEDEEEFLTKEFSSVYEDAQCERLASMSKNELIQEYLYLEAKYETLSQRARVRESDQSDEDELKKRLREQEDLIRELRLANEKLRQQTVRCSSSADSESDSCSTSSISSSSSGSSESVAAAESVLVNGTMSPESQIQENTLTNGHTESCQLVSSQPEVDVDGCMTVNGENLN